MPDPDAAAPEVARALVHAGADILSITEPRHSLEDVYLQLVDEDVERSGDELQLGQVRAILQKELRDTAATASSSTPWRSCPSSS